MKFSNREILCEAPMMTMMAQWAAEKLEFGRYGASDTSSSFCNVTTDQHSISSYMVEIFPIFTFSVFMVSCFCAQNEKKQMREYSETRKVLYEEGFLLLNEEKKFAK